MSGVVTEISEGLKDAALEVASDVRRWAKKASPEELGGRQTILETVLAISRGYSQGIDPAALHLIGNDDHNLGGNVALLLAVNGGDDFKALAERVEQYAETMETRPKDGRYQIDGAELVPARGLGRQ